MPSILIVDDDSAVRDPLRAQIEHLGHECDTASDGFEGVERVKAKEYDLVLTDIRMPGMDGLEFLSAIRPMVEHSTPCIVITAFHDFSLAVRAVQVGAYDFVTKPWHLDQLRLCVQRAMLRRQDLRFRREYQAELERRVAAAVDELKQAYDGTVIGFASILEGKDTTTAEHCTRVRDLCSRLGREMGIAGEALRDLELGAMLHDIGKCRVPDAILNKAGPLTPQEWDVMRLHPTFGADIVERIHFLAGAADVVRCHHEKWDGSGYPRRLAGEAIPLSARVFMVVDAYDTITSRRSYKSAQSPTTALDEIRRCSGKHFDPDVVAAFERIYPAVAAETGARHDLAGVAP